MDIFDRIQYIVDKQGDKLAEFCRKSNVNYETLRGILKYKKSNPGYEVLKNIILNVAWVNPDWLMTGRGDPERKVEIISAEEPEHIYELRKKEDRLLTIIESQQRTIENLSKNVRQNIAGTA